MSHFESPISAFLDWLRWLITAAHDPTSLTRTTNMVLSSNNCDTQCTATLRSNLDTSSPLTIEFDRFVDSNVHGSEGLYIQYSTDDTNWTMLASYTHNNRQDTNVWEDESLTLDIPQNSASLRFVAESNRSDEYVEIDNLSIFPKPADTTPPMIDAPPDMSFTTTETTIILTEAHYGTATATDLVDPSPVITNNATNPFGIGDTVILWTATDDARNSATDTQLITVIHSSLEITAPADVTVEATGQYTPVDIGNATATHDTDADLTIWSDAPESFEVGTTPVTWTVRDSSNITATAIQRVTVQDTTPPSFDSIPANIDQTITQGNSTSVSFDTPAATDLADPDVEVSCLPPPGSTFGADSTTVTCTTTDDSGNSATASFVVSIIVIDATLFQPTGLVAMATDSEVVLTWLRSHLESATGYQVLRDSGSGMSVLANDTQSTDLLFVDRAVSPGASYTYQVKGVTAGGLLLPSNSANATVRQTGILDFWAATTGNSTTIGWSYSGDTAGYVVDKTDEINSVTGHSRWFLGNDTHTLTDTGMSAGDSFVYHIFVERDREFPDYEHYDFVEVTVGQTNVTDATAPAVSSIERFSPPGATTGSQTLVYEVTFSEDVTGVDSADFALSLGSTGGTSTSHGQFTQTRSPSLAITQGNTVSDAITVPDSGTATSVSVSVDVSHTYIGDLKIDLIAPDGTTKTLHNRSGGTADDIDQTYTPDFGSTSIAGTWTLRINDNYAPADDGTLNGWTLTVNHVVTANPVTNLSGSGSTYYATVSAALDGTYNLDLISFGHGVTDATGNPLADPVPTGADHTYAVDLTAPAVSSIERYSPSSAATGNQTLVYRVIFSEDVTGVDASDFALSPDSTGGTGQFTQTRSPSLAITQANTITDAIAVPDSGTATSVSVSVDVSHTYIGDLKIDLIAPDGTIQTLHNRSGGTTDDIDQTYAPDFAGVSIAGTWTLRINDNYAAADDGTLNSWTLTINYGGASANTVTGVTGSGSTYDVTVSVAQDGTYNLDLASSGHGIADAVGNPLADSAPTGADETYTVSAS